MKRFLFIMCMLLACVKYSYADEIVVADVVISKGGIGTLDIKLNNEREIRTEVQFLLTLPNGISLVDNSSKIGSRFNGMAVAAGDTPEGNNKWTIMITAAGATDTPIPGNSGTLVTVDLVADDSVEEGIELNGNLVVTDLNLTSGASIVDEIQSSLDFQISIGAPADSRVTFDENSDNADVLKVATGVDVRVKRTILANQWSTICLPFAMTAEQVVAAFGNDVQLAEFTGWETTAYDNNGDPTDITVKFSEVSAINANIPYIIKVSSPISEFTADGVDINPDNEPGVIVGKKNKGTLGSFTGSYVPMTIDGEYLFLSDNKFWYSTGKTNMKGFRAYFYFQDVLSSYGEQTNAPVFISFNNETTGIDVRRNDKGEMTNNQFIYNLNGQRVEKPKNGMYIINNKKVVVK